MAEKKRKSLSHRTARGLSVLILSAAVATGIIIFSLMAILDLYNPPQDSKLGHQAMAIGAGAVAGAMSLIGVYIGMGANETVRKSDKEDQDNQE